MLGESEDTTAPFTFYQVKGDRYVVASGINGAPGETLYIAQVTDASVEIFDDAVESERDHVEAMAKKYGVSVEFGGQSWTMSGPEDAQRKFMIEIADAWPATSIVYKCAPL